MNDSGVNDPGTPAASDADLSREEQVLMERAAERLRAGLYSDAMAIFLSVNEKFNSPSARVGIAVSVIHGERHGRHSLDQYIYDDPTYYSDLAHSLPANIRSLQRPELISKSDLFLALGIAHQMNLDDEAAVSAYYQFLLDAQPGFDKQEVEEIVSTLTLPRQGCAGMDAPLAATVLKGAKKTRNRRCRLALLRQALRLERNSLQAMEHLALALRTSYPDNTIFCLQASKLLNRVLAAPRHAKPEVHLHFGDALHCLGRHEEACREYIFAQQQAPHGLTATKLQFRMAACPTR
jgi:hypothetical protein